MATVTPTTVNPPTGSSSSAKSVIVTTWTPIGDSDTCTGVENPAFADQTVQVIGTFASATVVIQGSNDNSHWATLTDPLNNNISFTSTGMATLLQNPLWIRPNSTGGSGSSITVILCSKS
jgi:hypothetical protein